jgi:hypothetical protein
MLDGSVDRRRPVNVEVGDPRALEPGLLLFAVFLVGGLADEGDST